MKGTVAAETFKEPSQRVDAKKLIKKQLEERYASGKNKWFFQPLRVRSLFLLVLRCTHCTSLEYSSRSGSFLSGLLRMPIQNSPRVHLPHRTDTTSLGRHDLIRPVALVVCRSSDTSALSSHCFMAGAQHVPYLSFYAHMADSCKSLSCSRGAPKTSDWALLGNCPFLLMDAGVRRRAG